MDLTPITRDEVEASGWRSTPNRQHFYTASGELAMTVESVTDVDPGSYWGSLAEDWLG